MIITYQLPGLMIPSLAQTFPMYHRFSHNDSHCQRDDSQHQLRFVEIFAQNVECTRWRYSRQEKVQTIYKDERCGLEQGGCCDDTFYVGDLGRCVSILKKLQDV